MGQVHTMQLMARLIQMGLHAAEGQIQDVGDFLIGFSARRPDQALLLPPDRVTGAEGSFELILAAESISTDKSCSLTILSVL